MDVTRSEVHLRSAPTLRCTCGVRHAVPTLERNFWAAPPDGALGGWASDRRKDATGAKGNMYGLRIASFQ